ncbi:MAG: RnfABCDGE type electron transport complex subunit G [Treponema sp.]|jgi:electron transport complex protein RnfG|nr:RnfABCDGE type electron transport complex subunit G [Treponema sp.]
MSGKEPGALKLGFTLAAFASVACVMLAFVYTGTRDIIEKHQREELEAALREFFPEADDFPDITGAIQSPDPAVTFEAVYEARKDSLPIGTALRVSRGSYGGPIKILVGVAGNAVRGVKILEHKDTPGLGAKAASPSYTGQFAGKGVEDPFQVKADVEAITAATITSRAVADAVKAAGQAAGQGGRR